MHQPDLATLQKLARIDLNLLVVFATLDRTRNVTASSKALSLSQPALSHALGRLREALGDPLFVRTSRAMEPTPRAEKLAPFVHRWLASMAQGLLEPECFNPKRLERTFRLKTTDFLEALLCPRLSARLQQQAPLASLSVTSPGGFSLPREDLELGQCDLACGGFFGKLPEGFYQQKLIEDHFVCAARSSHPRLGGKQTLKLADYCSEEHALIAPGGSLTSKLDEILQTKKRQRKISLGLSSYLVSGWAIEGTDTVLTAPSRLVSLLARKFELIVFDLPFASPAINIFQVWHARNNDDAGHAWLRSLVKDICDESLASKPMRR